MDVSQTNIESLSEPELRDLLRNAEKLLSVRVAERARATLKEARRMAAEVGFDATFTKIAKPAASGASPAKAFAPRGPARQKCASRAIYISGRGFKEVASKSDFYPIFNKYLEAYEDALRL